MRIVFFLLLFLFSVNGWADCTSISFQGNYYPGTLGCYDNYPSTHECYSGPTDENNSSNPWYQNVSCGNGRYYCSSTGASFVRCSGSNSVCNYTGWRCDSKCAADSLSCVSQNKTWNSASCSCSDDTVCNQYRAQCEQANGVFSGSANNGCCIATCNQCGALKDAVSQKAQICCDRGLAPPDQARQCRVEARNTCGMNWSTFLSNDNEFSCQSPSVSAEASQRYADQCFDNSSSSTSNSSSSGGGSSGGDCPECPILEEILSTLTDQKGTVEEIYRCLSVPGMCDLGGDSLPPWVREKMDVMIDQDSITANNTTSIDSAVRAIGDNQKRSDSATRDVIREGVDSIVAAITSNGDTTLRKAIEGGFASLDSVTDALNDSTRKWLRFIADSLGVGADSIVAHIDSIVSRLPDSILDSILKYQKYASDNFDSAFWGAGNGFQKIDDLTDSAIKYFKQGFHYDSVYSSVYRDSLGEIHEAISSLSTSIGYALGYGDTATSTLREDLESLGFTIQDLVRCGTGQGDTSNICNELKSLVDEQKSFYSSATGYGDGTSTLKGDLEGIRQAIEGLQFGEGSGVISAFDSAINANGGGRVDTNGIYLPIYGGDSLADSIGRDVGYGGINVGRDTSAMDSVERLGVEESDSTICVGSECVEFDSDRKISDSLNRYIIQQGDSIRVSNQAFYRDSVDKMFQDVKDTLTKWNPFGMFDSTLMKTLGAKVPNTNTCPEHCTKFAIPVPFSFGPLNLELDWNLCHPWLVLGSKDVMSFLRFIIRVIVAVTCIGMVMQAAANTKIK